MKKIIALLIALVMVFALAACGQSAAPEAKSEYDYEITNDKAKTGFIFLHA